MRWLAILLWIVGFTLIPTVTVDIPSIPTTTTTTTTPTITLAQQPVKNFMPTSTPWTEASSIQIPPSTATSQSTDTDPDVRFVYQITWYGNETDGPYYCGVDIYGWFDPRDTTTVAVGVESRFKCGTRLRLCTDICLVVVVKDRCGACDEFTLDLSEGAWENLGRPTEVIVERINQ